MHNKIFPTPAVEARHRGGLLGAYFDCFVTWMQDHGYSRGRMRLNVQGVTHFGQYLRRKGIRSIHQLEEVTGQKLLVAYRHYCKRHRHWQENFGVNLYLRALKEAGVLTNLGSKDSLLLPETQQYVTFLKNQKGLSEKTIHLYTYWVEKFLRFLGYQNGASSMPTFGIADVDRFIEQKGVQLGHASHRLLAKALRSFLRFLYQSGNLYTDLSSLITSPRHYKLQSLPQVLSQPEVQKILSSLDRSTKTGLQQYAILILLTTYGLRVGEVAHIKLEDIDWRNESIHIAQRKTRKDLRLPLMPQAGKAVLDYLKGARPPSKYREIFLLTRAPYTPLNRNYITHMVSRYIKLTGLNLPRYGAHLLRHSFATHLIRKGVSLKQIGDMLGHRNPESTHIYTKTATEHLREVALEIPEVRG